MANLRNGKVGNWAVEFGREDGVIESASSMAVMMSHRPGRCNYHNRLS